MRIFKLTEREQMVGVLLAQGLKVAEIGPKMGITPSTVSTYLQRIRAKTGAKTSAEIVSKMWQAGLVNNFSS